MFDNQTKICFGCMEQYNNKYDVCPNCGYHNDLPLKEAYHLSPGTILKGRYIVGKVLGFGGFGITYIGWDFTLERKIAIKEYLPSEFSTRTPNTTQVIIFDGDNYEQYMNGINKFIKEAQCLAGLDDIDGIVKIYSSFAENNTAYIIMEYLDGCTLAEKIEKEGKIPPQKAFEMMLPLMTSLSKVHQENILHRDISPDNIFCMKDGTLKLIDFGAARVATAGRSKSLSVIVKPGYAPTEQYRSRGDQGTWTDVYAVAATLYKMITGVTPVDSMERSVKDTLKPPSKLGIKISSSAENALMNALNIRFEQRTHTIEEFQKQLFSTKEVKRIVEHNENIDIGKTPLWMKIVGASLAGIAIIFVLLLTTGVFQQERHIAPSDYSMPDGKTKVPSFVNKTFSESQETAKEFNLNIITDGAEYTDDIPKDMVYSQSVTVGSLVDINSTVKVQISAGVREIILDYVVGLSQEEAKKLLEKRGFKVIINETKKESAYSVGAVCETDLTANESYKYKTQVTLTISKGIKADKSIKNKVPNFIGKTLAEAEKLAEQNGFIIKVTYRTSKTQKAGNVISQSLENGVSASQGTEISLIVSKGLEKTTVPYLKGRSLEEADSMLKAQYLTYDVTYEYSDEYVKGHIISQSIESNTVVDAQTKISLVVSKGKEGETSGKNIKSITVSNLPNKTTYYVGETFDETGLAVTANYDDGTSEILPRKDSEGNYNYIIWFEENRYDLSSDKWISAGATKVEIDAQNIRTMFEVEVLIKENSKSSSQTSSQASDMTLSSIYIAKKPARQCYYIGDSFDSTGMIVKAKYNDGSEKTLSSSQYSINGFNSSSIGDKTIVILYNGKKTTFTVSVIRSGIEGDYTDIYYIAVEQFGKENLENYIFFDNSETKWSKVFVYWWEPFENAEWPGKSMIQVGDTDIWAIEYNKETSIIIINNGIPDYEANEDNPAIKISEQKIWPGGVLKPNKTSAQYSSWENTKITMNGSWFDLYTGTELIGIYN